MLLLGVMLFSLIVGLARGGSLVAFGQHRWRFPFLPVLAVGMQVVGFLPDESASGAARAFAAVLHILSYLLAFAFIWVNRRTPWLWLMAVGLVANAIVILANGGFMPVSPEAVAGTPTAEVIGRGHYNNAVLMGTATRLWFLGDVLRTPRWLVPSRAFSIGDLTIAVAAFGLVQHLMRPLGPIRRRGTA